MIKLSSAKRYAKTIFELGQEKGLVELFSKDMAALKEVADKVSDFVSFLANPVYSLKEREALFSDIAQKLNLHSMIVSLVNVLIEGNKVKLLPYICKFYQDLEDFYAGRVRGVIKLPMNISDNDLNAVKSAVEAALKKKVEFDTVIDKDVIGGVWLKIGDVIYDGTVKKQLAILKDNLIKG